MTITHVYNLLYYTPKLWERVVLACLPLQTHSAPDAMVWYKRLGNRLYILGYMREVYQGPANLYERGLN